MAKQFNRQVSISSLPSEQVAFYELSQHVQIAHNANLAIVHKAPVNKVIEVLGLYAYMPVQAGAAAGTLNVYFGNEATGGLAFGAVYPFDKAPYFIQNQFTNNPSSQSPNDLSAVVMSLHGIVADSTIGLKIMIENRLGIEYSQDCVFWVTCREVKIANVG